MAEDSAKGVASAQAEPGRGTVYQADYLARFAPSNALVNVKFAINRTFGGGS